MDISIASILTLDGLTNGAVYALLGLATVLVFTVTRVIFIPQGEFVAYGALTLAMMQTGKTSGTVWLLLILAVVASLMELVERWQHHGNVVRALKSGLKTLVFPAVIALVSIWAAPQQFPFGCKPHSAWPSSRPSVRWSTAWPTSRSKPRPRSCCSSSRLACTSP